MNRSRPLVVLFCLSVLGATVPSIARAQSAALATAASFRGASASQFDALSAGDQLAATATIQEVVSTHIPGSPRGTRLILASPQGMIDASVGPYLAADVQQSLVVGESVTVDGVLSRFNSHEYLLVRRLTIGDRLITIRNEKGFLVHPPNALTRHHEMITKGDQQ